METSVRISFQGLKGMPHIRDSIAQHVAELEQRFGRITACHVSVVGPGEHHKSSGHYQVHVRLALPDGREVNADRSPTADARLSDLPSTTRFTARAATCRIRSANCKARRKRILRRFDCALRRAPALARGDGLFGGGDAGQIAAMRGGEIVLRAGFAGKEQPVVDCFGELRAAAGLARQRV
jgi:hypothetical protein